MPSVPAPRTIHLIVAIGDRVGNLRKACTACLRLDGGPAEETNHGTKHYDRAHICNRCWADVMMGTTANQKTLFFNLRKAKSRVSALEEGDLRPDHLVTQGQRRGGDRVGER
jgi:hypothetical protein